MENVNIICVFNTRLNYKHKMKKYWVYMFRGKSIKELGAHAPLNFGIFLVVYRYTYILPSLFF